MTRLFDFASKLSGCLALVCALLAVLPTPSSARADDLTDCQNCCAQTYTWGSIEWNECVSQCRQGVGSCAAASCSANDFQCAPNTQGDTQEACDGRTCDGFTCGCQFDSVHCHCK